MTSVDITILIIALVLPLIIVTTFTLSQKLSAAPWLPLQDPIILTTIKGPFSMITFPTIISELQRTATVELSKDA